MSLKEKQGKSKSSSESQDKRTGEIVEVDAVWVPKLRLRSKCESSTDSRTGSREYATDQVSSQALQAINKRDNVLSQKGLGDFAGILKCFYTLHTRIAVCDAAIGKSTLEVDDGANDGSGDTGSTPADFCFDESEQENLMVQIEADPVMKENAGEAVCLNYLRRTDLFDSCNVRSDFAEKLKNIAAKASSTKVVAAALRKCVREMDSMIKADRGVAGICNETLHIKSNHTVGNKQFQSSRHQQFTSLASVKVSGGKMLVCCCAREASKLWQTESLPELRVKLMSIQAKCIPDALMLPSLCAHQIRTGDLVLMPAGFLVRLKPHTELFLRSLPEVKVPAVIPSVLEKAAAAAAKEEEDSEVEPAMAQTVPIADAATAPPVPSVPSVPIGDAEKKDDALNGDDAQEQKLPHDAADDDKKDADEKTENANHSTTAEAPEAQGDAVPAEEISTMCVEETKVDETTEVEEKVEETKVDETTEVEEKEGPVFDETAEDDANSSKVNKNNKSPKKDKKHKGKKDKKDADEDKEKNKKSQAADGKGSRKKKEVPASRDLGAMFAKKQKTS
eukprot:s638_g32.t1